MRLKRDERMYKIFTAIAREHPRPVKIVEIASIEKMTVSTHLRNILDEMIRVGLIRREYGGYRVNQWAMYSNHAPLKSVSNARSKMWEKNGGTFEQYSEMAKQAKDYLKPKLGNLHASCAVYFASRLGALEQDARLSR